ncbi:MFS transporter [Nonomuraea sp. NPDC050663]|uniref:MFS transporter n=1 Tax=Nonomuraea sp. NPDC050663 TaxID=3364370 RepID=UPI0037969958
MWRNRDFRLVWVGHTLSDFGSGVSQLAFPLLALALTGSPVVAGLVGAARAMPYLLLGLIAGALVDRWDRKRVMIVCDLCRAVNIATIPLALWLGELGVAHLVLTAFLGGVFYVFFSAAEESCLPNVVGKEQLTAAVSARETASSTVNVVAPTLGGALFALGRGLPFVADALSYLASALCLSFVRAPFRRDDAPPAAGGDLRAEILDGLRWLWNHSALRLIAVTGAGLQVAISGIGLVVIVSARQAGASPAAIGVMFTAIGVGGVAGAVVAPWVKKRLGLGGMLLSVLWAQAALWVLMAFSTHLVVIAVILGLFTVSMPLFGIAVLSYRLEVTPDHLLGRVGTAFSMLIWGATPIGTVLAGWLLDRLTPMTTSLVFAGWVVALSAVASLGRGLRSLGQRVDDAATG